MLIAVKFKQGSWRESLCTKLSAQINGWIAGFQKETTPADQEHARKALQDWMNVSELASVRGASQLSLLPREQRDQWSRLCEDVQGCINRARDAGFRFVTRAHRQITAMLIWTTSKDW